MNTTRKPFLCPVCGDEVSPNARACPGCGACDKSGWRAASLDEDGLDLPDEDFDYNRFVAEEFGGAPKKTVPQWFWTVIAAVLLLAFAVMVFRW